MRAWVRTISLLTMMVAALGLPCGQRAQAAPSPSEPRVNPDHTLAIIVNRSNPIDNLPFGELRKIFLGERNHWSNGHRIAIAMLDYGQPERRRGKLSGFPVARSVPRRGFRGTENPGLADDFAEICLQCPGRDWLFTSARRGSIGEGGSHRRLVPGRQRIPSSDRRAFSHTRV